MKRIVILFGVIAMLAFRISLTNPVPEKQVEVINAFPPEIGVMFYFSDDISGDTIYTTSGIAIIDSGVAGEENELVILDSSNTSGFTLNPESDLIDFPQDWYNNAVRYGTLGYAPPPIRGHSIHLSPYCRGFYAWSFEFSCACWGATDVIINEVNSHGTWEAGSYFIELYNRGDTVVCLDGWRIVCDTIYDFPSDTYIPPSGYWIIDAGMFPAGFDMDYRSDNIYLTRPYYHETEILVDQVGWSSDHGENVSFMRYPDGDVDTSYWGFGYAGYDDESSYTFENGFPSRGAPNRHESPGFVVIGTRGVGGESWVDLCWTDPIWETEFDISVAVRSETGFPETPDDGIMVYEGDAQQVTDTGDLYPGQWYYYTVFARDLSGGYSIPTYESRDSVTLSGAGVIEDAKLPDRISYLISYPNPFNATTTLQYSLLQSSGVTIEIYNIVGQRAAILFKGTQQAGEHSITWDASSFPSGVYFARLEIQEQSKSIKMVLLK